MPAVIADLPPPVNHVFVDFENVHQIDLAVIGSKAVSFTLLVGPRQTKLDASLVEKLFEHAVSVQLVRLTSVGRNALDFAVAYYLGRAVAADPGGYFHIVSKDTGFDPLIEHLRGRRIIVHRHDSFASLTFSCPARLPAPVPPADIPKPKPHSKPKAQLPVPDELETQVLEHLRKHPNNRPKRKTTLVSHLLTLCGNKITETSVQALIERLGQAGHVTIDEKNAVTYSLAPQAIP